MAWSFNQAMEKARKTGQFIGPNDGTVLTVDELRQLCDAISSNLNLTSIELDNSKIGDKGAASLAKALEANNTITSIHLRGNDIGYEGAESLAKALRLNSTLRSIDLTFNNIGNKGAKSLAMALKSNNSLTSINLSSNQIGNEGAMHLARTLKSNFSLITIHLEDNNFTNKGLNALDKAILGNKMLQTVTIDAADFLSFNFLDSVSRLRNNSEIQDHLESNKQAALQRADTYKHCVKLLHEGKAEEINTGELTDAFLHARCLLRTLPEKGAERSDCLNVLRHYTSNLLTISGVVKDIENSPFGKLPDEIRNELIFQNVPHGGIKQSPKNQDDDKTSDTKKPTTWAEKTEKIMKASRLGGCSIQ